MICVTKIIPAWPVMKNSSVTETKISPFWWNLHHLLHCKFSLCSFQCRQWRKFRQSYVISVSLTWLFHLSVTHRYNKMTHIQIKNLNLNLNLHAGWIQIHDAVVRWLGLASVVGPGALSANFLRLVRVIGVHPSHRAFGLWQWNENIMALWHYEMEFAGPLWGESVDQRWFPSGTFSAMLAFFSEGNGRPTIDSSSYDNFFVVARIRVCFIILVESHLQRTLRGRLDDVSESPMWSRYLISNTNYLAGLGVLNLSMKIRYHETSIWGTPKM